MDSGWAGLILLYAGKFSDALLWVVRSHAEMEMSLNSVERVEEYSQITQEPAGVVANYRPPALVCTFLLNIASYIYIY